MRITREAGLLIAFMAAVVVEVDALRVDEIVLFEDFEQFVTAHLLRVASVETEDAQELGSLAVLGRGDLLEVCERPVHFVAVNVVDFHTFGSWSDKGLPDEMVTETVSVIAHKRVGRMHVWSAYSVRRTKSVFEFAAGGIKELALVGTVKDFAADEFRRDLFDNRYNHNALNC